ncbi:MAG TPA: cell division protein FtsZ [Bryobacteraceae bacterium]|nr:cell division protein FtsZ [Bryobacteraceae bacterium]
MATIDNEIDNLKYEIQEETRSGTRIKVIGIGGGGCNAVSRLVREGLGGVEFHAMDTDLQALSACDAPHKLQLGARLTKGLGAGSNAETGRQAALENTDDIVELLQGADMVFVAASLGGGTGTGAAGVVASLAKELDALTVAVVTKPFSFEGPKRMRLAEEGRRGLLSCVDTVITIPNERLLALAPRGVSFLDAFKLADDMLYQAVQGISDIINTTGVIDRDFSDIRAVMAGAGYAMMGTALARGANAAVEAARQAISCPLLEDTRIAGAARILINLTGSRQLSFHEVNEACALVREAAQSDEAHLTFGVILDESMGDSVKVTVIATGVAADAASVPHYAVPAAAESASEAAPPAADAPPEPRAEVEPDPMLAAELPEADAPIDLDDLVDTPAYLTQGRLLN